MSAPRHRPLQWWIIALTMLAVCGLRDVAWPPQPLHDRGADLAEMVSATDGDAAAVGLVDGPSPRIQSVPPSLGAGAVDLRQSDAIRLVGHAQLFSAGRDLRHAIQRIDRLLLLI